MVTLIGPAFVQRVAASLLHAVGHDALVCTDRAAYRDTVLALADDAPRRAALRAQLLAQRGSCALFDGAAAARAIEALYGRMWQRAGEPAWRPARWPPSRRRADAAGAAAACGALAPRHAIAAVSTPRKGGHPARGLQTAPIRQQIDASGCRQRRPPDSSACQAGR